MRKLGFLVFSLGMLAVVIHFGAPRVAEASATCSTACPGGASLSCCTTGTCSTTSGVSVNCNGTILSCGPADTYKACKNACISERSACLSNCATTFECNGCTREYNSCLQDCGTPPVTNIGC